MNPHDFRLLVVDDEDATRRSLADILRLEGYTVQTVPDGESAISILHREKFDLVLLDLKMPGVDGIEVLRFINQSIKGKSDTQVILLTAHGSLESSIDALRYGAYDYLLKPSSPEQILRSVSKGLEAHSEKQQKQQLIEQLEISVRQLRALDETKERIDPSISKQAIQTTKTPPETTQVRDIYKIGASLVIDLARREIYVMPRSITQPGGQDSQSIKAIALTPTEGKLFKVFLDQPRQVFSHRELVFKVYGYDVKEWEAPEVLRPLVSRLRRKLDKIPAENCEKRASHWIVSVRGTGYVFDPEIDSE